MNWELIFSLPNLSLHKALGNENIAIVPNDDSRITEIASKNNTTKHFVEGFGDQFKREASPSFLIIPGSSPDFLRDTDTLVGFRNIIALSSIIKGYEHSLQRNFLTDTLYSDYFDFYPISVSRDGKGFITNSPSVRGYDDAQDFKGQTSPALANSGHVTANPDIQLFSLLEKAWKKRYIKRKLTEWYSRKLFRSLEMAYQATTLPFKNHSTIYDFGSSACLWVSAFEILSHPRVGTANLRSVLDLLGGYKWENNVIKRKAYKIDYRGNSSRYNLIQKLYKELYDTRNDFLHGNPVRSNRLHPFRQKHVPAITRFAPLIYKVALLSFLNPYQDKRKKKNWQREYMAKLINEQGLSEAILVSKKLKKKDNKTNLAETKKPRG